MKATAQALPICRKLIRGAPINFNTTPITEAHWRQLPRALRAQPRRRLGGKASILNHQVHNIASALCERGAYDLAFDLYRGLRRDPLVPYQGCGLGLLMNLRELMGEGSWVRTRRRSARHWYFGEALE
jgi:hypothetical protein